MPVRFQPEVLPHQCLKFYLLDLYQKRVNLTDADKFLATFKTQKPKQTCSNYMDEFAINYENYAHLKWSLEELNGIEHQAAEGTIDTAGYKPEVIKVESNIKTRKAEMLRLVADGLCSEFKTHCDNTKFDLNKKSYIEIEKEVMYWQRSTTTGKKFTATCILAKPTTTATVAAMEFDRYLDSGVAGEDQDESFTSSTQSSQQSSQQSTRGQAGGRGARGSTRGNRGRGGRGRGAVTGRPVISRDTEDGNHPNYIQTADGQLKRSVHGFPLCNYCGGPSHKRQNCPIKMQDRAAGKMRLSHPDRDKGTSIQEKKKLEQSKTSAAVMAAPTKLTQRQYPMSNPCPYPTCHAILTDYNQTQEHINQFHTIPTLARGPGAEQ